MNKKIVYGVSINTMKIKDKNVREMVEESPLENVFWSEGLAKQYANVVLEERASEIKDSWRIPSSIEHRFIREGGTYAIRYEIIEFNLIES